MKNVSSLWRIITTPLRGSSERKYRRLTEHEIRTYNLYCSSLIGIGVIILQAFIPSVALDLTAYISVVAFSASMPLMAGTLLIINIQNKYPYTKYSEVLISTVVISSFCALIGLAAAIWHISWVAGGVFLTGILLACIIYMPYVYHLKSQLEE